MPLPSLRKTKVYIFDCLANKRLPPVHSPLFLDPDGHWKTESDKESQLLKLQVIKGTVRLAVPEGSKILCDGELIQDEQNFERNKVFSIQTRNALFLLSAGKKPDVWDKLNAEEWWILTAGGRDPEGPFSWKQLARRIEDTSSVTPAIKEVYPGNSPKTFSPAHIKPLLLGQGSRKEEPSTNEKETKEHHSTSPAPPPSPRQTKDFEDPRRDLNYIDTEGGNLVSPFTWEGFGTGDVMHIASHEDLKGDDYLGPDAHKRFHAIRFTDQGHAVDPMGSVCPEMACPHTHLPLPPGFLERPQHIISLIGAPSAGKSYFLCVLTRKLAETLYQNYNYIFKDTDPSANANFNAMKNRLFSGGTSKEAALVKTRLDGDMYISIQKEHRSISLPRPFSFVLQTPQDEANFIFYDNAGEHFEPGRDSLESPGGRHVAYSDALFFLFDPVANKGFREVLKDHEDPQLKLRGHADQQDILITETEARIRKLRRLPSREKWNKPFALLLGKADIWLPLLEESLEDPLKNKELDQSVVDKNSAILRNFLVKLAPTVVANLESFSGNLRYFAVSSFGHSPESLENGALAPDPSRINPSGMEAPFLWTLNQLYPGSLENGRLLT